MAVMTDLEKALKSLRERQSELEKAELYYEGTQPEVFASTKLKRALKNTGTSFRINFAKTPVDSVLNRLEIASITSSDGAATDIISEVWTNNQLDLEADEAHRWTLVYGDGYLMVWPDENGDPQVTFNSPRSVQVFYDEENTKKKKYAAKVWELDDGRVRVNLYYATHIEKWVSKAKKPSKQGDFEPFIDTLRPADGITDTEDGEVLPEGSPIVVWPIPNPYNEVPVFHFRTQRPFGRPEHKDAFGPQDMINKLVITQMASNDYHGFPQRYVLAGGTPSSEMTDFNDDSSPNVETSSLNSGPGELWWINSDGKLDVGQFDAADADAFLKPFEQYVRAMASVTSTPLHYFEGMREAPSGESLRSAEAPLIKKVLKRQALFGATWEEVFRFILRVLEIEATDVNVRWHTPQSLDDKDAWDAAKAKQDAGVPVRQTLLEAGYTDEQVDDFGYDSFSDKIQE